MFLLTPLGVLHEQCRTSGPSSMTISLVKIFGGKAVKEQPMAHNVGGKISSDPSYTVAWVSCEDLRIAGNG